MKIFETLGNKDRLASSDAKPAALAVEPDGIPVEMKGTNRFVVWKFQRDEGRWTKVLYNPATHRNAKTNDPSSWSDFTTAWGAYAAAGRYDGIGFCLGDGWAGVDLDDCRDPETGQLLDWANKSVHWFDTYADVSPTKTGVKIFLRGKLTAVEGKKVDPVEVYDHCHYFTITGIPANGCPSSVNERSEKLNLLYDRIGQLKDAQKKTNGKTKYNLHVGLTDEEIVAKASMAKNCDKFNRLWAGDTSGYLSPSEADSALMWILAFYTKDPIQLDRLFRKSKLPREKYERDDYRTKLIKDAIAGVTETYGNEHLTETDIGNGKRFTKKHGVEFYFAHLWKKWIPWNGQLWGHDNSGSAVKKAKDTILDLFAEGVSRINQLQKELEGLKDDADLE